MKLSLLAALLCLSLNVSQASQPGSPFSPFVPSGGGYKGAARLFPLTLESDPCDRGFSVKLVKSPGLVRRFRLFVQETYRGICTEPKLYAQLEIYNVVEENKADGTVLFTASQTPEGFVLSDRRGVKANSQPTWVALIGAQYYQATVVSEGDLPTPTP